MHKSSLQRVKNLTIRTDLADLGLVVMKHYLLNILIDLEDGKLTKQSLNHGNFFREFVPYLAKHQFKKVLNKYDPRANENEFDHMISRIMQPTQTVLKKDFIKVHVHIVPKDLRKQPLFFCRLVDDDTYAYAKTEVAKDAVCFASLKEVKMVVTPVKEKKKIVEVVEKVIEDSFT